ncbi:hypothetical protein BVC93_22795 [Mycobacterium sp. MS1601]|uniref:hypothetical protein n=1 Tax=Mycobacterium sp. MS1601 TaxID=1936029 RepID=UPI0009791F80|nr:hypothetical protein [Mycobacterium sp. MS1601]AQA04775.1 hypothetical protein BVC93_22795 [Mycobacterium sp. MS1601]
MKIYSIAAAAALSAGVITLAAPAAAAPSGVGSAADTIANLKAQGYTVVVNRLSDVELADAKVVSVGVGPTFIHTESVNGTQDYTGYDRQFAPVRVTTAYVNVR